MAGPPKPRAEADPVNTGEGSAEMSDFSTAFPNSKKIHVDGPLGVRVPMREIALGGGEPPLSVYDTSGPQGHDVKIGLPKLRASWVGCRRIDPCVTQLHYARTGEIT